MIIINKKITINTKKIALFLGLSLLYYFFSLGGFYKYLFLIGITSIFTLFNSKRKVSSFNYYILLPNIVYVFIGIVNSLIHHSFSYFSFKQMCFYFIPSLSVSLLCLFIKNKSSFDSVVNFNFFSIGCIFLFENLKKFSVENLMESQYAFIFGAYCIYFLYQKKYKYLLVSFVLMILSNKRIAICACILCCIILIIFDKFNRNKLSKKKMALIALIFIVIMLYIYIYLCDNREIMKIFSKYNINTQGRTDVWRMFNQYYDFNIGYTGQGIGWCLNKLQMLNIDAFSNLHNDVLSSYIELGFIGFGLWIISHYYIFNTQKTDYKNEFVIIVLYIYTFLNYFTDNISIYLNYFFPYYFIIVYIFNFDHNNKE